MTGSDQADDERPSKSARKREHQALQALAVELIALPETRFRALPLGERAREELQRARRMSRGDSLNRQVRLIAQLLLEEDLDAVRAVPAALAGRHAADTALHHAAERLRDALLQNGLAALGAREATPEQRERAAHLLAVAGANSDAVRARGATRELYRLSRELLTRAD